MSEGWARSLATLMCEFGRCVSYPTRCDTFICCNSWNGAAASRRLSLSHRRCDLAPSELVSAALPVIGCLRSQLCRQTGEPGEHRASVTADSWDWLLQDQLLRHLGLRLAPQGHSAVLLPSFLLLFFRASQRESEEVWIAQQVAGAVGVVSVLPAESCGG